MVVVLGAKWDIYCALDNPVRIKACFIGTLGYTDTLRGTYQVIEELRSLLKWVQTQWVPAFQKEILQIK